MHVATICYDTKHGTDHIFVLTNKTEWEQLPTITNKLLEKLGVVDPEVEGDYANESAEWQDLSPLADYPVLEEVL